MALLSAMLTVALVTFLAAGAFWQQWRTYEVEAAERQRQQAAWLLNGAMDWARLVLREDSKSSNYDHLGEPWALPLQEARLASFLSSQPGFASSAEDSLALQVFLSGGIVDLQGRLNVANLLNSDQLSQADVTAFAKLWEVLSLPSGQLVSLVGGLRQSRATPKQALASAPLPPQRLSQLAWLGVSAATLAKLQDHVVWLPERTPVNLNTASAEVMYASLPGLDLAEAQRLVRARANQPWRNLEEVRQALGGQGNSLQEDRHSVASRFFEITGQIRLDSSLLVEKTTVQREGLDVRLLWRERGVPGSLQ
jgi:general secretion pathway protein K